MRILVLSDIHGSETGVMTSLELCQRYEPDLAVVCGDITQFGPNEWGLKYLDRIPVRTLAVPGNCDPEDLHMTIEKSRAENLHKKKTNVSGLTFVGGGGSDPTPFNTIFEIREDVMSGWLEPLRTDNAILVTHAPAYGFLDRNYKGSHSGSKSIRRIVDSWNPILHLSGHMHEARGVDLNGETVCVNPGPAKDGLGALVDLLAPHEIMDSGDRKNADVDDEMGLWSEVRKSIEARLLKV